MTLQQASPRSYDKQGLAIVGEIRKDIIGVSWGEWCVVFVVCVVVGRGSEP